MDVTVLSWIGGEAEQIDPILDEGNKVLSDVEVLVMRSCCGLEGAPCTARSQGGPSVKAVSSAPAVQRRGSKNLPSSRVGKGKVIDSLGLSVWPLEGRVGNSDPKNGGSKIR